VLLAIDMRVRPDLVWCRDHDLHQRVEIVSAVDNIVVGALSGGPQLEAVADEIGDDELTVLVELDQLGLFQAAEGIVGADEPDRDGEEALQVVVGHGVRP
jgi:hypothetical protein